jgi:hypothetical protein
VSIATLQLVDPDHTLPPGARAYPFPSCGACLRIAERRGLKIGQRTADGFIEGFEHATGEVMALVLTNEGEFILPVSIKELALA